VEIVTRKHMMLFGGTSHPELAKEISEHLGVPLSECTVSRFASTEVYVRSAESARGADVFLIQTHAAPVNEAIMEQLVMIDAMKRQDKKSLSREPISAKLVADLLATAGADRVVSVDLHSGQIQGFFDFPFDHLTALPLLTEYFEQNVEPADDLVVVAPDTGRVKVAERLAGHLHADLAFIYKKRSRHEAHKIEALEVVGEVSGRPCVVVDDMIDTGGTMVQGAKALAEAGAADIYIGATHGLLSGKAVQKLEEGPIKEVVVTNTVPIPEEKRIEKLTVVSIAPVIASALRAVFEDESVSEIFHGENQP
jgi:ribose-phosphate pyrophosphokinase